MKKNVKINESGRQTDKEISRQMTVEAKEENRMKERHRQKTKQRKINNKKKKEDRLFYYTQGDVYVIRYTIENIPQY